MNLLDAIKAIAAHNWLALALLVLLYMQKLASSSSAFPWNPSPAVRNLVFTGLGLAAGVIAGVQAQLPTLDVVLGGVAAGVATGFVDGLVAQLFGHGAPAWVQMLLFVVKDIGGGGGAAKPPTGGAGIAGAALALALAAIVFLGSLLPGCTAAQVKTIANDAVLACQVAEQQPEPAFVYVVCDIIDAAGNVIDHVLAKVPKEQAAHFLSKHKPGGEQ